MSEPQVRVMLVGGRSDTRLLRRQLGKIGSGKAEITWIELLDEALESLGGHLFDTILLDLSVPDKQGIEIVRRIRGRDRHTPIIWLSDAGNDAAETEILRDDIPEFMVESRENPQAIWRAIRYAILRERHEKVLRENEARFRIACEASHSMVYDIDVTTGHIVFAHGLATVLGYLPDEKTKHQNWWLSQIHGDDLPMVLDTAKEARKLGTDYSIQYRVRHSNGNYIVVEDSGCNLLDQNGRAVRSVGSVVDITQRIAASEALRQSEKRYHDLADELENLVEERTAQLRNVAAELTHAEDRERKRLAHAIHDDLQQLLVASKFCADSLECGVENKTLKDTARQLNQFLREAIESARSLTFELSPPILHEAGLARALQYLGRRMEAKHGLTVSVRADESAEPEAEEFRILLFQSVRELLFNIVKHAKVNTAEVEMRRFKRDYIQITVSDSGAGFDVQRCDDDKSLNGFGLFSIRGRLDLIGGNLEISSAPGAGSRCTITAPLARTAAERLSWRTETIPHAKSGGGMLRAGSGESSVRKIRRSK